MEKEIIYRADMTENLVNICFTGILKKSIMITRTFKILSLK
jgi:hypothetical protein